MSRSQSSGTGRACACGCLFGHVAPGLAMGVQGQPSCWGTGEDPPPLGMGSMSGTLEAMTVTGRALSPFHS